MNRLFRKYHHWLAIVCALPLLLTVITGMTFPIAKALHQRELAGFLIHLHTLETFGLDGFFPIINGLGLFGLLITGMYMSNLFKKRRAAPHSIDF
ncbi:peptidase [Nostoc sp. FACHB-110]|uniref:peptidase n=1 Tax=Nostoc sp. FACHB-110 TaxID=2692834 RepID=UPI001686696D|nr:peptidase [Nostoc sp. FACHB-110]MBD2436310.1 peptidase [Nostoc sp. FACHB-110]